MSKDNKKVIAKDMSDEKLLAEVLAKKKELMSLRFKLKLGELTDTSLFKKAKKNIASLQTELTKRRMGEGK